MKLYVHSGSRLINYKFAYILLFKYKKLHYGEEHSVSVVLSWCTL